MRGRGGVGVGGVSQRRKEVAQRPQRSNHGGGFNHKDTEAQRTHREYVDGVIEVKNSAWDRTLCLRAFVVNFPEKEWRMKNRLSREVFEGSEGSCLCRFGLVLLPASLPSRDKRIDLG